MHQVKCCVGCIAAFVAGGALLRAPIVQAQDGYPAQPVRLVIPFPPGGQTDNVGRQLHTRITPFLGQQLLVDNRGGAAGAIGSAEVARAKPDGYTLLIATTSTHAINPNVMPNLTYSATSDFTPITVIGTGPIAISVHPIVPAQTLRQLIAEAKARPGYYSYGSSGVASINNLAGELFKMRAGNLEILHVPYKGAGPSMQDLMGGQIEIVCSTLSAALPHHRQARVRTLAVMKVERSLGAPEIPTTRDAGLRDAVAYTYNIILAPARTPRSIVDHVSTAIAKVMADESFRDTLVKLGVDPIEHSGPEKAAAMLDTELAKWRPIIQALGLGADTPTRSASPRR